MNNFDRIAPLYDLMSRIVFGQSIIKSQTYFLTSIKPQSRILIIGGGTGQILNYLDSLSMPLQVTYIEQSRIMLKKSQNRQPFRKLEVKYILGNELSIPNVKYEVVLTAFFLDVFQERHLEKVVAILANKLELDGQWMVTDFVQTSIRWQRMLLRLMYFFFKHTTGLQGNKLLDFSSYLSALGFAIIQEKEFYHKMIKSTIYQRSDIMDT